MLRRAFSTKQLSPISVDSYRHIPGGRFPSQGFRLKDAATPRAQPCPGDALNPKNSVPEEA